MFAGVFPFVAIRGGTAPVEFLRKEGNMAKTSFTYKLVVKDGDTRYDIDKKTGQYASKVVDYVATYDDLGDALLGFLEYATDSYNEEKVTLTLTPKKSKK